MPDYIPKDEPGLDAWFENWGAKMNAHGSDYGFIAAEIQQAQDDAAMVANIVSAWLAIEAYRSEYSGFKRIMLYGAKNALTPVYPSFDLPVQPPAPLVMLAGIIKRTRSFVRRLKESSKYNEAVGADFRVIPATTGSISEADAKPTLKPQAMADSQVDIAFAKGGFDGVDLEMQRGDDANAWTPLGRFYGSPAEDDTPPLTPNTPEVRRYRGRYLRGNKPVGQHSDIVSVITNP